MTHKMQEHLDSLKSQFAEPGDLWQQMAYSYILGARESGGILGADYWLAYDQIRAWPLQNSPARGVAGIIDDVRAMDLHPASAGKEEA